MGAYHAAFASADDARDALQKLADAGFTPAEIEMRSSAPLDHHLVPLGSKISSRVPWMALIGGVLGGIGLYSLVSMTSRAYPLPTGGMPIVAAPTTGVIVFEGIAIGAIICTVLTVLFESGLPGRKAPGPLDHHIADDRVLITVQCDETASTEWARTAVETARI